MLRLLFLCLSFPPGVLHPKVCHTVNHMPSLLMSCTFLMLCSAHYWLGTVYDHDILTLFSVFETILYNTATNFYKYLCTICCTSFDLLKYTLLQFCFFVLSVLSANSVIQQNYTDIHWSMNQHLFFTILINICLLLYILRFAGKVDWECLSICFAWKNHSM